MRRTLNKLVKNQIILIIIGIDQVLGGLFGLYLLFTKISLISILQHLFLYLIVIGLFVFSIICGVYLFDKKPKKGIKLSLINQYLQLIQLQVFGVGYYYVAGIYLSIGIIDVSAVKFKIMSSFFQSSIFLTFKSGDNTIYMFINLVSIIIILLLSKNLQLNDAGSPK